MNRKESDVGIKYKNGDAYSAVCPYGVDDVYVTFSSVNPATRWPGTTWTLVTAGTFLVAGASSGTYKVGNTGGEATHKLTIDEMPSHTHGIVNALGAGWDTSVSAGDKLFYQSVKTGRNVNEFFSIANSGGGNAHNNMPPYIACYMWRRTGGGVSPCSDAEGGESLCLSSSSRAGTTGKPSAHGALETSCSQRLPRIRTSNGRGLLGRSTRRTGSPSAQVRHMRSETRAGLLRSLCRSRRCQAIPMSYRAITTSCSSARDGLRCLASRTSTSTTRLAVKSHALREAAARMRTALRTLPSTFGGALHRGAVA